MKTRFTVLLVMCAMFGFVRPGTAAVITVFNNQFNTTWDVDNDNNGVFESTTATYTPTLLNAKFREHQPGGSPQVWNIDVLGGSGSAQPWNGGGVIFAGGGNSSGAISTSYSAVAGGTYSVAWDADLLGNNVTPRHALTLEIFDGAGTLGTLLGSQVLDTNPAGSDGLITFVAPTTGLETIRVRLSSLGNNSSTDIQLDFVNVTANIVPEPATLALVSLSLAGLGFSRRKKA